MKLRFYLLHAIFVVYLYVLVRIILFKGHGIDLSYLADQLLATLHDPYRIVRQMELGNVVPFYEIKRAMESGTGHGYLNVFGNIAIFAPFGLIRGMLGTGKGMTIFSAAMGSLFLSLTLEWLQAVFVIGSFDVDDMVLNTCGGLMGYLLYRLMDQARQSFCRSPVGAAESITPTRTI
ncbi:MAG: VanZ family protein [Paenibacillus sp.]|nr:VanZ family protein [Paenibacillus sp.]